MRNSAPDADRVVRPLGRLWGPACRRVVTASRNLLPSDSRPFLPKIPRRSSLNRASTYRGRWRRSHRGKLTSRGLRTALMEGCSLCEGPACHPPAEEASRLAGPLSHVRHSPIERPLGSPVGSSRGCVGLPRDRSCEAVVGTGAGRKNPHQRRVVRAIEIAYNGGCSTVGPWPGSFHRCSHRSVE